MINYQLKTWKNKDADYLKFIDKCTPIIARVPADQTGVTHHHVNASGGLHGNDYLSLPITWYQHTNMMHSGTPEDEVFEMIGIDPIKEIVNHLIRYILTVLKKPIQLPCIYTEDNIRNLIKIIKFKGIKYGIN